MNMTSLMTAIIGLGIAGGSAYMARDFVENQTAQPAVTEEAQVIEVVVASRDIAFGQAIEAHMLTTIKWPAESVPDGIFSDYASLLPQVGDDPRRARRAISQGELILAGKVSDYGEKITIVQTLGPNRRAMAIRVNAETAVGGFVTPGDYVDVVLTQGRGSDLRAVTIMQNIRVIGVDQKSDEQSDTPEIARTVTVDVSPEQSQTLALAQQAGRLSLTLRNFATSEDGPLQSTRLSDVLQDLSPVEEAERPPTIVIRRGTQVTVQENN